MYFIAATISLDCMESNPNFALYPLWIICCKRKGEMWSVLVGVVPVEKQPLARLQSALTWKLSGVFFFNLENSINILMGNTALE